MHLVLEQVAQFIFVYDKNRLLLGAVQLELVGDG